MSAAPDLAPLVGQPLPPPPADAGVSFTLELGAALHRYGAPAHRLEDLMSRVAGRLGLTARFFSTPTSIFASFGPPEALQTSLIRVEPGVMDLGRLADLDTLTGAVIDGTCSPREGRERLARVLAARVRYGPVPTLCCFALASAAHARLFGGGPAESVAAALIGLFVGALVTASGGIPAFGRVLEVIAAAGASALAVAASRVAGPLSVEVATLAGLIVLLPGLSLTVALTELATRNLISGTARLAGAGVVLLELGFGVAAGGKLASLLGPAPSGRPAPLGADWTTLLALVASALALVVLFRARRRDVLWTVLAVVVAYGSARAGGRLLGPELGAFTGAVALGVTSNAIGRLFDRPSVLTIVPGLMALVPGSLGFRSLESLLAQDVVSGVASAFTMILVGVSLVAGLLVANAVVPARKAL